MPSTPDPRPLTRDNHYVSQAYLRRWASTDGRLGVYRTLVSHEAVPEWRRHSLKGIAYHQHLYTQVGHGVESDVVERWLAEVVESPSENVLEKVAGESRLTPQDWDVLLRLFIATLARTPAYYFRRRLAWERELTPIIEGVLRNSVTALEAGTLPEATNAPEPVAKNVEMPVRIRVRRNSDGGGGVLEAEALAGRKLWFFELERMVTHTWKALRRAHWTVLRAPEGSRWITSDDPAVVAHVSQDRKVTWNGGMMVPGTVLMLPLSPEHALYGKPTGVVPLKYSVASPADSEFIQNCLARRAFRMIFACDRPSFVATARPRRVDPAAYDHERREFAKYHAVQSRAEADLEDDATWHVPPTEGE